MAHRNSGICFNVPYGRRDYVGCFTVKIEIRILTHEAFRPLVEAKGVIYKKLDTDTDHVMQYLVTDYNTSMDFMKGMFRLKKENPAFMKQTLDAVAGSDLVMYGTCSAFAYHAAEYLHIPCARLFYSPMDSTRQYSLYSDEYHSDRVLKSYGGLRTGMNLMTMLAMNRWRKSVGLPKWTFRDTYTERDGKKLLTFYPTSPVLMPPDPAWGGHIHVTGYWYHPGEAAEGYMEPEDLAEFLAGGEKPIFVTFGKAVSPEIVRLQMRMLQVLKETGIRAVVQVDRIPKSERVNTDRLYFIGDVPYPYIFDRVRAVVHHGGNTTNGMGLRAGLPTLVIPLRRKSRRRCGSWSAENTTGALRRPERRLKKKTEWKSQQMRLKNMFFKHNFIFCENRNHTYLHLCQWCRFADMQYRSGRLFSKLPFQSTQDILISVRKGRSSFPICGDTEKILSSILCKFLIYFISI